MMVVISKKWLHLKNHYVYEIISKLLHLRMDHTKQNISYLCFHSNLRCKNSFRTVWMVYYQYKNIWKMHVIMLIKVHVFFFFFWKFQKAKTLDGIYNKESNESPSPPAKPKRHSSPFARVIHRLSMSRKDRSNTAKQQRTVDDHCDLNLSRETVWFFFCSERKSYWNIVATEVVSCITRTSLWYFDFLNHIQVLVYCCIVF